MHFWRNLRKNITEVRDHEVWELLLRMEETVTGNLRLTGVEGCVRINTYFHMVEWLCGK